MFRFLLLMVLMVLGLCAIIMNNKHSLTYIIDEGSYYHEKNTRENQSVSYSSEISIEERSSPKDDARATNGLNLVSVNLDTAIKKFLKKFPETSITSIELEQAFDDYFYEIQGVDDHSEYSLKINATSGEIGQLETDTLDFEERNGRAQANDTLEVNQLISIEEVSNIAEQAGGGVATKWSLEKELSTTYWEVVVRTSSGLVDVKIDSKNGNILELDKED